MQKRVVKHTCSRTNCECRWRALVRNPRIRAYTGKPISPDRPLEFLDEGRDSVLSVENGNFSECLSFSYESTCWESSEQISVEGTSTQLRSQLKQMTSSATGAQSRQKCVYHADYKSSHACILTRGSLEYTLSCQKSACPTKRHYILGLD